MAIYSQTRSIKNCVQGKVYLKQHGKIPIPRLTERTKPQKSDLHLHHTLNMSNMNVLIYSGPGTTPACVNQCLETFRVLFTPYYSVSTVSEHILRDQPWEDKTAVIIIPGGADLPIVKEFREKINEKIKKYVQKGGKYIGICSGGYYGSGRCEFEVGTSMEVSGPRELKFFPGTCRGGVFRGFKYGSEAGARVADLKINTSLLPDQPNTVYGYVNGGGLFVDANKYPNVQTLAYYGDKLDVDYGADGKKAAVVLCKVSRGDALLFGPHLEFSPDLLKEDSGVPRFSQVIKSLAATNKQRIDFLRSSLKLLGLKVSDKVYERPKLSPLFLTSIDGSSATELVNLMEHEIGYHIQNIMDVGTDKFAINKSAASINTLENSSSHEDPNLAIKKIYLCDDKIPDPSMTPYFDLLSYKNHLVQFYQESEEHTISRGAVSNTFMYGEVVTSTSVLMDINYRLLPLLPDGFTIIGTVQVLGRGRSGNHWVNPRGVLPVSTLLRMPMNIVNNAPLVFVQYLSSMAYTRAILEYDVGYNKIPVRIKWPNDIYIRLPEYIGKEIDSRSKAVTHAKIGGVLVNTHAFDDQYYLIVGAGLNVNNEAPTTSINSVIKVMNEHEKSIDGSEFLEPLREEKLLARYNVIFHEMFEMFKKSGFSPFLQQYYKLWFHSNQIVTLANNNNIQAQICGITPDWGMLMARDLKTGTVYELQPDGNSFDMFKGLISSKR